MCFQHACSLSLCHQVSPIKRDHGEYISKFLWKNNFWSPSYFAARGAPIDIIKKHLFKAPYILSLKEEVFRRILIKEFSDNMHNHFSLYNLTKTDFELTLENDVVGKVVGKGLITPKTIAWEFRRKDQDFEGYEVYELQTDGSYKVRAEFTSGDGLRTHVKGDIKQK